MRRFRSKNLQMLVATDVAARGLDVNDLTHVINYNLPDDLEVFTHRSGRTGRAGKAGIAIAIIHSKEKYKLRQIEKVTDKTFERHNVPSGKDICEKQLFSLIDKMENVKVNESQIKEFLPRIYAKLEILSREELIKQFVSLEFNRFLEYYKNAPDLNVYDTGLDKKSARGRREKGEYDSGQNTRFFINAGAKDGLNPSQLITLLNQRGKNRDVKIGKIDVMKKFSFFETPAQFKEKVLESFQKVTFQGRKLVIEIAEPMEPRETPKRKRRKSRD
jgi:ATP-dependent RNA helicase DeaD